jgi:predicted glycoside hydrolase/deacetylase ChbG (UPF0249 family)
VKPLLVPIPKQVEMEITAQIERARALGITPTHLDSHMGTLYQNKALFEVFMRVGAQSEVAGASGEDVVLSGRFFAFSAESGTTFTSIEFSTSIRRRAERLGEVLFR